MRHPYVGITGVRTPQQASSLHTIYRNLNPPPGLTLHLGMMMSRKTLYGMPTSWARTFPTNEQMRSIVSATDLTRDTLMCLHYADYEGVEVEDSLVEAFSYACPGANAVQLDMIWPDPDEVAAAIHRGWQGDAPVVILQVGRVALEQMGRRPVQVAAMLGAYNGIIDGVLLDESGGEGRPLSMAGLRPLAEAVQENLPHLWLSFAGGLDPENVYAMTSEVLREFPGASIDAQTGVSTNRDPHCALDLTRCAQYLREACRAYAQPAP